jgi:hypothetical protein
VGAKKGPIVEAEPVTCADRQKKVFHRLTMFFVIMFNVSTENSCVNQIDRVGSKYPHTRPIFLPGVSFLRKSCNAEVSEIFLRDSISSFIPVSALLSNDRYTGLVMFAFRESYSYLERNMVKLIGGNMLDSHSRFSFKEKNKLSTSARASRSLC